MNREPVPLLPGNRKLRSGGKNVPLLRGKGHRSRRGLSQKQSVVRGPLYLANNFVEKSQVSPVKRKARGALSKRRVLNVLRVSGSKKKKMGRNSPSGQEEGISKESILRLNGGNVPLKPRHLGGKGCAKTFWLEKRGRQRPPAAAIEGGGGSNR